MPYPPGRFRSVHVRPGPCRPTLPADRTCAHRHLVDPVGRRLAEQPAAQLRGLAAGDRQLLAGDVHDELARGLLADAGDVAQLDEVRTVDADQAGGAPRLGGRGPAGPDGVRALRRVRPDRVALRPRPPGARPPGPPGPSPPR